MKSVHFIFAALAVLTLTTVDAEADELSRDELTFFETKIRPVLIRECYGCHSKKSGNARGGLTLDTKQLMAIGGTTGPAIVPGDLDESWLYNAITHQDYVMPPKRKLPDDVIADFRKWIEMGAPDPRVNEITKVNSEITEQDIELARKSFWAYQKPVKHDPPEIVDKSWPKSDIDHFILAKLEQAELEPTADAEPAKILRRLKFDLVGLPPTPEEISAFDSAWNLAPDKAIADSFWRNSSKPNWNLPLMPNLRKSYAA